nr:glycosyltransferase [Bacteroidota bacterium]
VIESTNKAVKIIPLGFVSQPEEIASCYATADAFMLPSSEDNLPNTMLESLAVGIPVISFEMGGMKEHITNGFNGELASEISAKSLSMAIERFFSDETSYVRSEIRQYAESQFGLERQARAYQEVYKKVLE